MPSRSGSRTPRRTTTRVVVLGAALLVASSSLALAYQGAPGEPANATATAAPIDVDANLATEDGKAIRAQATVEIAASTRAVRDAILDLDARAAEGWMVDAVDVYRDDVSDERIHRRAKWSLSILGFSITYHCVYDWRADTNEIVWALDDGMPNDLDHARGVYTLAAGDAPGTTSLSYTVEVGSKHSAAAPLKRRITKRNVAKLLGSVRTRAEAGAGS